MPSFINPFWFALKNFVDNFNRTTSTNLGTSSGGQVWTALRGTWTANGTQGTSSDNATTYPIASYDIGIADTVSKIDSTPGTGVVFWLTDANSWWAAFPYYDATTTNTCNAGQVSSGSNPPAGNCCSTVTSSTTNTCNAGYTTSSNSYIANCCDGGPFYQAATSGTCNGGLTTNSNNPPSGSCCSTVTTNPGTNSYTYAGTPTTSGGGYCCAATAITKTAAERTAGYDCCPSGCPCSAGCANGLPCVNVYTASYYCPSGYTLSSYSCYYPTTTTYTCPSGGSDPNNTGTCTVAATPTTYSCYTSYTGGSAAYYYCNTSYTSSTTYSCYTSYTSSTTYSSAIRIISSVSGTVTTDSTTVLATSTSGYPAIASMDLTTSGTTITAKGYTSTGQVTQVGSTITRTPTSPTRGTSIGIIKAPSAQSQGSTVDNYSVSV